MSTQLVYRLNFGLNTLSRSL